MTRENVHQAVSSELSARAELWTAAGRALGPSLRPSRGRREQRRCVFVGVVVVVVVATAGSRRTVGGPGVEKHDQICALKYSSTAVREGTAAQPGRDGAGT